jgi:hypothetical protein
MENKLDLRRVALLLRSYWIESKKLVIMALGTIVGVMVFLYYTNTHSVAVKMLNKNIWEINNEIQAYIFIYGIYGIGIVLVSYIFKNYSTKINATAGLMVPASYLEKLLAGSIICLILFPFAYCIIVFTIDYAYISYLNFHAKELYVTSIAVDGIKQNTAFFFQLKQKPEMFLKPFIGFWFCTQIFTMIGMIQFQKQALLKTLVVGILSILAFIFANLGLYKLIVQSLFKQMPVGIRIGGDEIRNILDNYNAIFINIFFFVLPIIFIITAYYKLKEKQV